MTVFLVEDDDDDVALIKKSFRTADVEHTFHVFTNGKSLLEFISINKMIPDYILIDFTMPMMNGIETVINIRKHLHYQTLPIIMLSTSNLHGDIELAYKAGVNSYMSKPSRISDWTTTAKIISTWVNSWVSSVN